MNLEDHIGDIVAKARSMTQASAADAARAAGLSESELATLESTGQLTGKPNFAALAPLLGLNGPKLEQVARGWLPTPKDLGTWRELRRLVTEQDGMAVNAYLIWDEVSREAALFDTGWNANEALKTINENRLQLRHIFLTHDHDDHVAGLAAVRAAWPKVRLHSGSKSAPVDQRNRSNDFIHLGSLRITNRETPGHSEDGTTYIIGTWPDDAPHVAVVGDALFAGSIGRGVVSWGLARQKVREQILSLPAETLICPGHGPLTTVAEEKAQNPFF
jgi:glyoxylase-like metal-dependent hydrolase (beta-lactamase superfamily II)